MYIPTWKPLDDARPPKIKTEPSPSQPAGLDHQPRDKLPQAPSASDSTIPAKQNSSRLRHQLPVLPGSGQDTGLAAASITGTRTSLESKNAVQDFFPAPSLKDGTLDFTMDAATFNADTSSFDADEIFNKAVRARASFNSALSTVRVQGQTAVAVYAGTKAEGITLPPLTPARTPSARSARRIAREASNAAVQALTALSAAASAAPAPAAHKYDERYAAKKITAPSAAPAPAAHKYDERYAAKIFTAPSAAPAPAAHKYDERPPGSTAGARECSSTPWTGRSRPASQTCSPAASLRFPSTPDYDALDTEDEEAEARELRRHREAHSPQGMPREEREARSPTSQPHEEREARSPRSLPHEELLEEAALWQAHKREQTTHLQQHALQSTSPGAAQQLQKPQQLQTLWLALLRAPHQLQQQRQRKQAHQQPSTGVELQQPAKVQQSPSSPPLVSRAVHRTTRPRARRR